MGNDAQALAGVRVLELTNYIAGPVAARIMADLGAEVIKVELPPCGDYSRQQSPIVPDGAGITPMFAYWNRGKQSICVDFKHPKGVAIVKDLVRHVDVVFENFTPGLLVKYGIGYEVLSTVNPGLIMCSISALGQTGPLAHLPGNDAVAQSMSGVAQLTGTSEGDPVFSGIFVADGGGGVNAFAAVMTALFYRERSGLGQYIDVALSECMFHLHDTSLINHLVSHGAAVAAPFGSQRSGDGPNGFYRTRDGYILISVLSHHWERFTQIIGRPELKDDPRFVNSEIRSENRHLLVPYIERWLQSLPSREAAIKILQDAHVLCAPVLTVGEAINHPQLQSRGLVEPVTVPGFGKMSLPKAPYHFSRTPPHINQKVPMLGEDNSVVLGKYLGYGQDKIDCLLEERLLGEDVRLSRLRVQNARA